MTSLNSKTTSEKRPALARRAHGRWYVMATVSLALFFIAVTLWQRPPKSYTAKVVVTQAGHHAKLDERDAIIAAIFQLHEQHAHTNQGGHSHADNHSHDHHGSEPIGEGQPHLLVDVTTIAGEKQISIWCATAQADHACAEARLLADAYVGLVNEASQRTDNAELAAQKTAALDDARQVQQQAELQLAAFQQEHAKELQSGDSGPSTAPPLAAPARPRAIAQPNPQWLELQQRLAVLRAAMDELLKEKTEAHPQVRDLQWHTEEVEAELKLVSQSIVNNVADVPPTTVETADAVVSRQPSPELLNRLHELEVAAVEAQQRSAQAEAEWKAVQERQATKSLAIAAIAGPAKVVSSQGAGASLAGVCGGGLIALLVGGLIAARSRVVREPAQIVSLQRVESLGIPVAAALTTGDGPMLAPPEAINPQWVSWLTFVCELLIAAIALLLLLSACADWQFAAHLLRDPLSALTDAANRMW